MKAADPAARFILRTYKSGDLDELCAIDLECFPEPVAYDKQTMRETIEEKDTFTLIAEDPKSGSIAAFIVAGRSSPWSGQVATIDVLPKHRRRGLATRLMQEAESRLAAMGVRKLRLETATRNVGKRLFAKLGYKRTGRIERYYPDGSDAWVMEKPLARAIERQT